MSGLALSLFGQFQAMLDSEPLAGFRTAKVQALLIYLAIEGTPQRREALMTLFWPGMPERSARQNMRQILYYLRRDMPDLALKSDGGEQTVPLLLANRQTVQLNPQAEVSSDVVRFESLIESTQNHDHLDILLCQECRQNLETAAALYRGDFLADFYLDDSNEFEEWGEVQRQKYRRQALDALETLTTMATRRASYVEARSYAERQLEIDDLRESAYRQLMKILALNGQRAKALALYESYCHLLAEELGMAPATRTSERYEQILAGDLSFAEPAARGVRGLELKEKIGEGTYGAVHRAVQPAVGREVAVKVIRRKYADDPEFIRRFEAEAQVIARLEHPYIVPLYDYWRNSQGAYLIMRLLRGGSLLAALESGPWDIEPTLKLVDQVSSALAAAHQQGVIHRDIKPANILLDEAGNAYLSDFGIAKQMVGDLQLTAAGAIMGTPDYVSPEQLRNEAVGPPSDVYSLGTVLYETLTGERPFPDVPMALLIQKQMEEPIPPVSASRPDVPRGIDAVIHRATAKEAADRYDNALAMAEAFRQAVREGDGARPFVVEDAGAPVTVPAFVEVANPYKGLRAFQESDADDFYGRETQVQLLASRLGESRFLAVVGPSGSGKSSLVKAGLLPALRQGAVPGSETWFMAEMVPGEHPLEELELALLPIAVDPPPSLLEPLQKDKRGLLRTLRRILPGGGETQLLLVIDQFEELFTLVEDDEKRRHFLDSLFVALSDPHSPLHVVVTLRADFYDRPLQIQPLAGLFKQHTEVVLPLNREELTWAIREPAGHVGVGIEESAVSEMVADVADQPGALPLLQYTLTELFDERQDGQMTLAGYRLLGGVSGALRQRAEEIYAGLDEAGQEATRQMFLRLVTLGEGVEDTRRRVSKGELEGIEKQSTINDQQSTVNDPNSDIQHPTSDIPNPASEISFIIDSFGGARLLTFDRDPVTRGPTVEIAHEALLKEWPRLAAWLEENRDDVRLGRRLTAATGEWMAAERDPGLLASETRLAQYKGLAASDTLALTGAEAAYVSAAVAAKEAREDQALRTQKLMRGLGIGASVAAVVAIILALLAFNSRSDALREAAVNRSIVLATTAEEAQEAGKAERALALALEAVNIDDPPPEALSKLGTVAYGRGTQAVLSGHSSGVSAAAFSPDGEEVLSGSCLPVDEEGECGTGELIRWNLETGEEVARWTAHEDGVTAVAWHPDGEKAFTGGGDGSLIIWDIVDSSAVFKQQIGDGAINDIAFSPDQTIVAVAAGDGRISLVDIASGDTLRTLEGHGVRVQGGDFSPEVGVLDVAFSPDGQQLVSGGADALIILWDIASGEELQTFTGHTRGVNGVVFVDEGATILSSSFDQSFRKWDVASGEQLQMRESGDQASEMVLSPDGRHIIHNASYVIYLWDPDQFDGSQQKLLGHAMLFDIQDLGFSNDGRLALSASEDGTVRVWRLGGSDIVQTKLGFPAMGVAVAPDGETLAIGSWGPDMALWDVAVNEARQTLSQPPSYVYAPGTVSISADGRYVAGGAGEYFQDTDVGSVAVWEMASGELVCDFQEHITVSRTVTFGPDNRVLSGSMGGEEVAGDLIFWDAETCEIVHRLPTNDEFSGVDVSADGHYGLSSAMGYMTLWDLATGEAVSDFEMPDDFLLDAAFGPRDETVLASSVNGDIMQWDRETGEEVNRFIGHDGGVWAIDVSGDGRWLASSDDAGLVVLWDMASGEKLRSHHAHGSQVFHLTFSPDDQTIYSVSTDETLVAWQIGDPSLEGVLGWIEENRYVRELTCEEREQFGVEPLCEAGLEAN